MLLRVVKTRPEKFLRPVRPKAPSTVLFMDELLFLVVVRVVLMAFFFVVFQAMRFRSAIIIACIILVLCCRTLCCATVCIMTITWSSSGITSSSTST